ncbi:MAG: response regulator transcription factor [Thermoleophilaceae bacterium]|nr:response regulator transcription factor [Thermoleophilaceae bacterium]
MSHALVVDDDPVLRNIVVKLLERSGWTVSEAGDGREGLRSLFARRPDVIVLDVNMPEMDGWQALERIRDVSEVPVLMLTARDEEMEKVRGLQGGADDYVTKPFGQQELLARCERLAKRAAAEDGGEGLEPFGDERVTVDPAQRTVTADGEPLALTPVEYRLVSTFARNPGQVLSRDQLLELVWGDSMGSTGAQVKVHVGRLRGKLADAGLGEPIQTVRGFGYRYDAPS